MIVGWRRSRLIAAIVVGLAGLAITVQAYAQQPPQPSRSPSPSNQPRPQPEKEDPSALRLQRAHAAAIRIIAANFGHIGSVDNCSALEQVKRTCDGQIHCAVRVVDTLCSKTGAQPPLFPTLDVRYKCYDGDVLHTAKQDKPFVLRITCSEGIPPPQ